MLFICCRPRDVQSDRRIEDRGRFEQRRFAPERERDNNRERDNRQLSPQRERQDRTRNDRRPIESNYREQRMDGPRRGGNLDWRPRDREFRDRDRRPGSKFDPFCFHHKRYDLNKIHINLFHCR